MTAQYKKGNYITYSNNGVCLIEDIKNMDFQFNSEQKKFYVLKPVSEPASTIFVPIDNDTLTSKIRYVLSKKEVDDLIVSMKEEEIPWIEDKNTRANYFQSIMQRCDQQELLRLISCLYLKRKQLAANKKNLLSSDESILKRAEDLIENEFSFVLNISTDQVGKYIREKLEISEDA
jgi:CarD family transcriptional regulator